MHITIVRTNDEEARALTQHAEGGTWIKLTNQEQRRQDPEMALLRAIWHRLRIQVGRTRARLTQGERDTYVIRLPDP
jgi:hypothetical protein